MADNHPSIAQLLKSGIIKKGSDPDLAVTYVSTGIPALDSILGKGLARGRWYMIVGETSGGKTFTCQQIAKQIIAEDKQVGYIDLEYTYDPEWWQLSGVDVDKIYVARPESGEQAIDAAVGLIDAGVGLLIIDTLAAMVPGNEMIEDADYNPMAGRARLLSAKVPKLVSKASRSGTIVIAINQIRHSMTPGQGETYPGGEASPFYSSAIIRIRRAGWLTETVAGKDKRIGFKMSMECRKNKTGIPFEQGEMQFRFDSGFDVVGAFISEAIDKGIITRSGPYYQWNNLKWLGSAKLKEHMATNTDDYGSLMEALQAAAE